MTDTAHLASLWNAPIPHTTGERCLNARHRARNCRICVEACPVNAISIPDHAGAGVETIALDPNLCVRCGVCLNVCPTGVFSQPGPPELGLPRTITRVDNQTIVLACPYQQASTPPAPDMQVDQSPATILPTPRCLGALPVPTLLELASTGKSIWLDDRFCHICPIGEAKQTIQRTIDLANRWLQVMGHTPAIHNLETAEKLPGEPAPQPLVHTGPPAMSRRDFFRALTSQVQAGRLASRQVSPPAGAAADLPGSQPAPDKNLGHRLAHHIPTQRQHLAHALRRLSPAPDTHVPAGGLPIADVLISDACTACGLCAQFCPTEAITFLSDGAYYVLHFSAALCLGGDCALCSIGCPTDAVHFGHEVLADELLSTQPRPLKAGRLASCPQCGALTHAPTTSHESSETPLCYVCRAQSQRPNLMAGFSHHNS